MLVEDYFYEQGEKISNISSANKKKAYQGNVTFDAIYISINEISRRILLNNLKHLQY